jgi:hypothetical protein
MTRRFPDKRNGLSYWDHALLARVKARGPEVSRIIGYTMAETYVLGYLVGDWYLFGRLLRMGNARNPQPLITLGGDQMSIRRQSRAHPFGEGSPGRGQTTRRIPSMTGRQAYGCRGGALWFNDGKADQG